MKTVGRYKVKEGKVGILEILPHVAIRLKALFPQIATHARPPLIMTLTYDTAEDLEWFFSRYKMEADDECVAEIAKVAVASRAKYARIEQKLAEGYVPTPLKLLDAELREYQQRAVDAFLEARRMVCGDDVGLGKTFVALGALMEPDVRPGLIVVQSHLIRQWQDQITSRLGLVCRQIRTTNPNKEKLKPADVYVTTYHRISGWVDPICSGLVKSVCFDEIQELRRSESGRYKAAMNISRAMDYVLGLSATPVYNYGIEAFNVMDVVSPGMLGSRDEFLREWCRDDFKGKVKKPKALGTLLRERHLFLRRTRAEVGKELPATNKVIHTVPYDQAEQDKVMELATKLAHTTLTGSFTERGQAAREFDLMLRMATGVAKAKFVAEYVRILVENDEQVLLMGWHRGVYEVWLKELRDYNPVLYTGSESPKQKNDSKELFTSGKSKVMVMSLRSGVGLDGLQEFCKTIVFGELDWSPQVHEQAIGRLRRDGQDDQVTALFLVSDGGSDPLMVDLLGLKTEQASGIVDPLMSGARAVQSDGSRIQTMARQFLEKRKVKYAGGAKG